MRPLSFFLFVARPLVVGALFVSLGAFTQSEAHNSITGMRSETLEPVKRSHDDAASAKELSNGETLAQFANRIGVVCERHGGRFDCFTGRPEVGDDLDVEFHQGCGATALHATVIALKGAELRDRAAPLDRRTVARLARGQRLCIEAIGRAGTKPEYYYATATGAGKIHWIRPMASDCPVTKKRHPQSRCVSGWIDSESIDQPHPDN